MYKLIVIISLIIFVQFAGSQNTTWEPLAVFPSGNNGSHALGITPSGHLIAGSWNTGIYRSTDNGASWTLSSSVEKNVYRIATAPDGKIYALYSNVSSVNISRSTDDGITWQNVHTHPIANNYTFGGGIAFPGAGTYVATLDETFGPLVGDIMSVAVLSTDGGSSWSQVSLQTGYLEELISVGSRVFCASSNTSGTRGVIYTDNGGVTWVDTGFPYFGNSIKADNAGNIYVGIWTGDQITEKLFKSTDGGVSWSQGGLGGGNVLSILIASNGNIYTGTDRLFAPLQPKIRRSTNNAGSWDDVNNGINVGDKTYSMVENPNGDIIAGTSGGTYILRNITGLSGEPESLPSVISLGQNYPNPFNPATKISFALAKAGHVSLKVYDINGKEVSVLIDGIKPAGKYEVSLNAENMSSGLYFYSLNFESVTVTKKMLLVK